MIVVGDEIYWCTQNTIYEVIKVDEKNDRLQLRHKLTQATGRWYVYSYESILMAIKNGIVEVVDNGVL